MTTRSADRGIHRPGDGTARATDASPVLTRERRGMAIIELVLPHLPVLRLRRQARRALSREELLVRRRAALEREQRELAWVVRFQPHRLY